MGVNLDVDIRGHNEQLLRSLAESKAESAAFTKSIGRDRASLGRSDAQYTRDANVNSMSRMRQLEREAADAERQHERTRRSFLAGIAPGGRRATGIAGLAGAITGGTLAAAPISGSLMSALSTMPALAAGIAPLVGTLPAIGAGALGAAEGVGVLKIATSGLMKVIEADTPQKLATALKGLDKPTQKLAYAFHQELHPALERLQQLAQKTVLPSLFKLGYEFTQLAKPKGAIFDGMEAAGKSVGKVINSITNLLSDKAFQKQLDHLLVGVGDGIAKLVKILPPMLDMFVRVENLALPFASRIGDAIGHWADKADDFVQGHGKQITQFFQQAFNTMALWGNALGDIAGIFYGISRAAGDLSRSLGQGITRFLDNINTFVNSKQGQAALRDFFANALPTLQSFGGLVKDLFRDLGRIGANPATQAFIQGLFNFLRTSLLPILNDVAGAIPHIGTALLPVMGTLDEFVNTSMRPMVDALLQLVQAALPPLVPLIANIADLLKTPLAELTSVVQLLTRALGVLQQFTGGGALGGLATVAAIVGGGAGLKKLGGGNGGPGVVPNILGFLSAGLYKPQGKSAVIGKVGKEKLRVNPALLESLGIAALGSERAVDGVKAIGNVTGLGGTALTAAEIASVRAARSGAAMRATLGIGRTNPAAYITEAEIAAEEGIIRAGYYTPSGSGIKAPGPRFTKGRLYQSPEGARAYRNLGLGPQAALPAEEVAAVSVGKLGKLVAAAPKLARNLVGLEAIMAGLDGLNTGLNQHSLSKGFSQFGKDVVEPFKSGGVIGGLTTGAGIGAMIGTVFGSPGVGTAIGAALGGVLGKFLSGGGSAAQIKKVTTVGGGLLGNFDISGFNKYEQGLKQMNASITSTPAGQVKFVGVIQEGTRKAIAALDAMRRKYIDTFGSSFINDTRGLSGRVVAGLVQPFQAAEKQLGSVLQNMSGVAGQELDQIKADVGSLDGPGLHQAKVVFGQLGLEIEKAIGNGQVSVTRGVQSMEAWLKKLDPATRKGGVFFARMLSAIQDAMAKGIISVAQGTKQMNALMDANLKALGVSDKNRKFFDNKYSGELNKLNNTGLSTTGSDVGNASSSPFGSIGPAGHGQRGLMTVGGNERMVGGDNVMAAFNGKPAVVANGENIAVFNRHQRAELNARLADVGGLHGFFKSRRKKHTDVPTFSTGGNFSDGFFPAPGTNYSVGQEPEIARRLDRLAIALHLHLQGISGWRSPQHSVEVGGFPNDPHTRGAASDTPGIEGVSERVLERFGLTRPFGGAAEADHIQLLGSMLGGGKAIGGGSGGLAGAIKKATLRIVKSGVGGKIGLAADAALKQIHDAMLAKGNGILGNIGPATGGGTSGANQALGHKMMLAMGWGENQWPALKALWTRESGWNQNARNPSSGAYGIPQALGHGNVFGANPADQIRWGLNYIKGRYGSPVAAWAHEVGAGWYSTGTDNTDGNPSTPTIGGDLGVGIPVSQNVLNPPTGHKKKKAKAKTKKQPFSSGPGFPSFKGIKPKKLGGAKIPGIAKKLKKLSNKIDKDSVGSHLSNLLEHIQGMNEQYPNWSPTLSLYDAMSSDGGSLDLTNFLNAHPEVLRAHGVSSVAEFIDKFGNGLEVLNTTDPGNLMDLAATGLMNQGVFAPGIPEHMQFDMKQLASYKDYLTQAQVAVNGKGGYRADLEYLHATWEHYYKLRNKDQEDLNRYNSHHLTWDQKVNIDQQKIDLWDGYLKSYSESDVSHRMTNQAKLNKIHAREAIKKLKEDIAKLKKEKTPVTGPPPKKGKHESTSAYQKRLGDWNQRHRDENTKAGRMRADIQGYDNNMFVINNDTQAWNTNAGLANSYQDAINTLTSNIGTVLHDSLPALNADIKSTTGNRIMPTPIDAGSGSGSGTDTSGLKDQLNEDLAASLAIANAQFNVFTGFAPMVGARLIGAFDHGGVVPRTGMALVHKGEFINPNPQGPFRNGQNAAGSATGSGDTHLELHLHGGLDGVVERAIMKHGPKIIRMTSEQQGRRTRLLSSSPGR